MAEDAALYWNKEIGNLSRLIDDVDIMDRALLGNYWKKAKHRISKSYCWRYIGDEYRETWLNDKKI